VSDLSEQALLSALSALKQAELIYQRGTFPNLTYVFRHSLTREVVHGTILSKNKKRLHRKIAISIEEMFNDDLSENFGVLADHYIAAENHQKGAEFAKQAAKRAEKSAALNDAILYTRKSIAALEKLPLTDSVLEKIIATRTSLGLYFLQYNYHVEAKLAVEPIFEMAIEKNFENRLSQIHTIMGTYAYMVDGDISMALGHLTKSLKIANEGKDLVSSFFVNHFLGLALSLNCEFDKALICFERALKITTMANSLWGIAAIKCMLSYFVYWAQGRIEQGYQLSQEALTLAYKSEDIYSKALSCTTHGILAYSKGTVEEARHYLTEGVGMCERIGLFFWNALAQTYLGEVSYSTCEYEKSKEHYAKAISLLEDKRIIPYWVNLNKMGLTKAKVINGESDIDVTHLVAFEKNNTMKFCEGMMKRYMGEIFFAMKNRHLSDVEEWITAAIEADKKNGMLHNLGKDYVLYSELCKLKGQHSKASESRNKALKLFNDSTFDGHRFPSH
jgi:tetratricopeptide (TPR) repeat protein